MDPSSWRHRRLRVNGFTARAVGAAGRDGKGSRSRDRSEPTKRGTSADRRERRPESASRGRLQNHRSEARHPLPRHGHRHARKSRVCRAVALRTPAVPHSRRTPQPEEEVLRLKRLNRGQRSPLEGDFQAAATTARGVPVRRPACGRWAGPDRRAGATGGRPPAGRRPPRPRGPDRRRQRHPPPGERPPP
jgi:hypothetical protein